MQTPMMNPALMQAVPMDGFQKGWETGMQRRREEEARNALAALVANPNDPQARQVAARHDPKMVMDLQRQQAEAAMQQVEQHRDQIKIGAQIIRQVQPKDQASWDQALMVAQQYGINPDQIGVPRQFDPSYVQNIVGLADALDPAESAPRPVVIDGVAHDPRTGEPLFESPYDRIIPGPNGSFYRVPRMGLGRGGRPATQPQGEVVNGELPPGWSYEDEGDASGNAGGGFL